MIRKITNREIIPTSIQDDRSIIERSVSFLLLGLICIFALNSIGNVQKYVSQYHHHWTGDALGIAFGTVVFVCAYIAATTGGNTRWVAVTIGTVFGIASAQFQTELYISEGMAAGTARALSFIPILAGEVGLALLESLYSKQHKQQMIADGNAVSKQHTQDKVQPHREEPSTNAVPKAEFDIAANGQMPCQNSTSSSSSAQRSGDLDAANDVRAALKEQRKAAIPQILATANRALTTSEIAHELQMLLGVQVSSDSVRRYCQELADSKMLVSVNRKWQLSNQS